MAIKTLLKKQFGDLIVKVTVKKWWLFVEIKKPVNAEYNQKFIKIVEDYCKENWENTNNISVSWGCC